MSPRDSAARLAKIKTNAHNHRWVHGEGDGHWTCEDDIEWLVARIEELERENADTNTVLDITREKAFAASMAAGNERALAQELERANAEMRALVPKLVRAAGGVEKLKQKTKDTARIVALLRGEEE